MKVGSRVIIAVSISDVKPSKAVNIIKVSLLTTYEVRKAISTIYSSFRQRVGVVVDTSP